MESVQKRELIWMSQANNRSSSEVDALGLGGELDGMDSYCGDTCTSYCVCDVLATGNSDVCTTF